MQRKASLMKLKCNLSLNLDGNGNIKVKTSDKFLDSMLTLMAKEALFDLDLKAKSASLEDIGTCLGEAIKKAHGNGRSTVMKYTKTIPIKQDMVICSLELLSRPLFKFEKELEGDFKENYDDFFNAFVKSADAKLHIRIPDSDRKEMFIAVFSAFGKCLGVATAHNPVAKYARNIFNK